MNFLLKLFKKRRQNKKESAAAGDDLFRLFVEQSSEGFAIADEQGIIIEWNHAIETLSGISRAEALGKPFWDIQFATAVPELRTREHHAHLRDSIRFFLKTGKADYSGRLFDGELLRPDGQRRAVLQTVYPIATGRGYRLASIMHDVTPQRHMERALHESEERFRKFFDLSLIGSAIIAPDGAFLAVNDTFCEIVGYPRQELCSMTWMDLTPPEDLRQEWPLYEKALRTGMVTRQRQEKQYRHKNGHSIIVELSTAPVPRPDGTVDCFIALIQDITERKRLQEALQQANFVVENSPVVLFRWKALESWPVVFVSKNVMQFGYAPEEFLSGSVPYAAIVHPDDRERVAAEVCSYSEGGVDRFQQEYRLITKQGDVRWIDDRTGIERDADGRITYYQGIVIDITVRKQTEEALRQSEERFRKMAENIHDGLTIVENTRVTYVNDRQCEITGYSREELFRIKPSDIAIPEDREKVNAVYREFLRTGNLPVESEYRIKRKDGTTCYISNRYSVNRQGSRIDGWYIITTDISERKRAENALRESEERLELALQGADLGTWEWYVKTGILLLSDRTISMLGYTPNEIDFQRNIIEELIHPDDFHRINGLMQAHLTGLSPAYEAEYRLRAKTGQWKWILDRGKVVDRDSEGRPVRMAGTHLDITDRKKTEETLRLTQYSIDHSVEAAFWIRPEGTFFYVNEAACRSLGYSSNELLQMSVTDIDPEWPAADWHERYEHLKHSGGTTFESVHRRKDTSTFPVQITANYSAFEGQEFILAFAVDITRQKMMQQEALRSAHFASIGELAAGVAHEINNPITGIINYAGLICEGVAPKDETVEIASRIMKEGERIGAIVRNLLSFARDEKREPEPSSVEEIFSDAQALFQKKLTQNNIIVERFFEPELPRILVNPQKIEQVFVNCLSNALDALNAKYPGADQNKRLEVQAAALTLDAQPHVRVTLHDHGIGIPEAVIDKICNPFFTTKQTGKGTGLGLSISYNIIKDYNGRLLFESREGEYTKVIIELPALE